MRIEKLNPKAKVLLKNPEDNFLPDLAVGSNADFW
jgi:predicted nucleic acid-binding protein